MIIIAVLLPVFSVWAGDLAVDNLTVSQDATVYGALKLTTAPINATATGGNITTNGNYRIHTFTNSGTLEVSSGSLTCDVLVVAGGGGGSSEWGGGGGGGGLIYTNTAVSSNCSVTVGGGGAKGTGGGGGANGGNSVFGAYIAYGGGGGSPHPSQAGKAGGSGGGGGGGDGSGGAGGAATNGQGYAGGNGVYSANGSGGGGGGAGGVGKVGNLPGDGGNGLAYDISGTSVYYAGGGGGGDGSVRGIGGSGVGGNGGLQQQPGTDGTANRGGGGGGGGSYTQPGGNGGSGIVIVKYLISTNSSSTNNSSTLTISSDGISQTNASGANTFMGKVGIGTNNPAEKLHVVGNVRVDGTSIVSAVTLGGVPITNWASLAAGVLRASSNLSDVVDKPVARTNLGLGSAATYDASVFLTTNGNGAQLTNITATQVGALSTNAGALLAVNNLSELTATAAIARNNLGLGSAAMNNSDAFLSPTGNGSQLTGITAAQVGALSATGGVINGSLSVSSNLFVNGTNVANLIGAGGFNSVTGNFDMVTNRIINLAPPVGQNDAVSKYYLWISLSNIPPMGDMSMGIYTNQTNP